MTRAAPPEERMRRPTRAEVEAVAIILWRAHYGKLTRVVTEELREQFNHDLHWNRPEWIRTARRAIALGARPPSPKRSKR